MNILNIMLCTVKMAKMVNFMLGVFYHNVPVWSWEEGI